MYNYKKKEGKLDKIRKIVGYRYRKEKVDLTMLYYSTLNHELIW